MTCLLQGLSISGLSLPRWDKLPVSFPPPQPCIIINGEDANRQLVLSQEEKQIYPLAMAHAVGWLSVWLLTCR